MAEIIEAAYNYDLYQQIYCLSVISNSCGRSRDTAPNLEKTLTGHVKSFIGTIPGSWSLSYGPCVYKSSELPDLKLRKTGPENAWFAATSTVDGKPYCVVAVAGTAATSPAALRGDILVNRMVDFEAWVGGWSANRIPSPSDAKVTGRDDKGCFISKGTAVAVRNVLGEKGHASPPRQQTILEYLTSLSEDYTVIFTGHSLGAAITPTIALGLVNEKKNLMGKKTVYVVPSAGASPGVRAFVNKYIKTFKAARDQGSFRVFNLVYYNEWDVVPQAWAKDKSVDGGRNFDNILEKTYNTATDDGKAKARDLVEKARGVLEWDPAPKEKPHYIPLPGRSFKAKKPDKNTADDLQDEVGTQHGDNYWLKNAIGIMEFVEKVKKATGLSLQPAMFDSEAVDEAMAEEVVEGHDEEQEDSEKKTESAE